MIEKMFGNKTILEPEYKDVMAATDLGIFHVVNDWPWGRKQRCEMSFSVETNRRGERFVKQSRFNGRMNKPKAGTYATRVKIIEIDGKIEHVEWHAGSGSFGIRLEDGSYLSKTFFDSEAKHLAGIFFGAIRLQIVNMSKINL
jgi:hypothetical protein